MIRIKTLKHLANHDWNGDKELCVEIKNVIYEVKSIRVDKNKITLVLK